MKYVVSWTERSGLGIDDAKQAMEIFGKWTPDPSVTFHQFVQRADGRGGYAVVETDNGTALLRDALMFGQWFEFSVTPVIDMLDGVGVQQQVIAVFDSIATG